MPNYVMNMVLSDVANQSLSKFTYQYIVNAI